MNTQLSVDMAKMPEYVPTHLRHIIELARNPANSEESVFKMLLEYAQSLHEGGYFRGYRQRMREEQP